MRALIWFPRSRKLVNSMHNRLSYAQREAFWRNFSSVFGGVDTSAFKVDVWTARFRGTELRCPLRPGSLWEDWSLAVGLLGTDSVIKETYDNILGSRRPPQVFVDIGANYGTHSLLFAASGVRTIAFEPNRSCAARAIEAFRSNNCVVEWHQVALGEERKQVILSFPEYDPSLGSISNSDAHRSPGLITQAVDQMKLDDYGICGSDMLIKIDVEGYELQVLCGGEHLINRARPTIIFETLSESGRPELHDFFARREYAINSLPWLPFSGGSSISAEAFISAQDRNFIAVPIERELLRAKTIHEDRTAS
jgi:FkbM family methyltransferase